MWRMIKFLILLVILATIALISYAYVGPIFFVSDFAAPQEQVVVPVILGTE